MCTIKGTEFIRISPKNKMRLDLLGSKNETYDNIVNKILSFIENGGNIKFNKNGTISHITIFGKKNKENTA